MLALFFVVGAFVVFLNFVRPAYREVSEMRGKELSLTAFRDEQKQVVEEIATRVSAYNDSEDVRSVVSLALPLTPALAEALAQLNGLAVNNRLAPQNFSVSAASFATPEESRLNPLTGGRASLVQPLRPVVFEIQMSGTYEDFKRFLGNLERNIRIFDVRNISVQPIGRPDQNLFQYQVSVATYYQNQ